MFHEDFIMRQVEDIGRILSFILFGKTASYVLEDVDYYQTDTTLRSELQELLDQRKVNEAENRLFQQLEEAPTKQNFVVALAFYNTLNQWDEAQLLACDFSYSEVLDGISAVKEMFVDGDFFPVS